MILTDQIKMLKDERDKLLFETIPLDPNDTDEELWMMENEAKVEAIDDLIKRMEKIKNG